MARKKQPTQAELAAQAEQNYSTEEEQRAYIRSAVAKTEAGQEAMKQFQEAWDKSLYGLYTATSPKGARSKALLFIIDARINRDEA